MTSGIDAAHARTAAIDARVTTLASTLTACVAVVALGAYGRRELTPHCELDVLFLHTGELTVPKVTETVCYPLWEQAIHVEPFVRTPDECAKDLRRSWPTTSRFLDARFVSGDAALFESLLAHIQPLRRDANRLRHRLRDETAERHAAHAAATASSTPDLMAGRGGLLDIQALRWLNRADERRTCEALDLLLETVSRAEAMTGHQVNRLSSAILERIDPDQQLLPRIYAHARWVAFLLDGVLAPERQDRTIGLNLSIQRGMLVAQRPPPLERAPALALRVANLVGLAPPSAPLLEWACHAADGPAIDWDPASLEQLWLLLRAADWRTWDFLDVTDLAVRYLPELVAIRRRPASTTTGDLTVDTHSLSALRRLHTWSESDDPLAARVWRAVRHRDSVYLAVLLHELTPEDAASAAGRVRLGAPLLDALTFAVATYQTILDTATRRDLYDEDLVLELATRIGTRQRLGMLFLVGIAHELAVGAGAWSAWKANLVRQLFVSLETALRQPDEVGARRARTLEQRREQIVRALERLNLYDLAPQVSRLPRRYLLARSPALAARHLSLLASGALVEGEVRIDASRQRGARLWDLLIVARDRPGLLAIMAGVLSLRGASVLAADAATSSDGLVLDVFTVTSPDALDWSLIQRDLRAALLGRIPLEDLLGSRPVPPEEAAAIHVSIDNAASQFFNVVEVRAPDQVGLLYRIASALRAEQLDIHHARIATNPEGALDVFYVRTLSGEKLSPDLAPQVANALTAHLRGTRSGD